MARKENSATGWTQLDRRMFLATAGQLAGLATASTLLPAGLMSRLARAAEEGTPTKEVATKAGKMRGLTIDGVHTFRGIQYGAPTGGDRRFLKPLPPVAWTGVEDRFDWGPYAPQSGRQRGAKQLEFWSTLRPASKKGTSEDCLYLNVWTRSLGEGPKKPVMMWIHGGGYDQGSGGSSGYAGEGLAKHQEVVTVSLNHRLNVLGYCYLGEILGGEFAESANQGQLDLVAALAWIHDNIEAFGGDPNRVMIYGQSGGGGKVSNLLGMPPAKGLFHAASIQSGAGGGGNPAAATQSAEELLKRFELTKANAREIQKVPLDKLMAAGAGTGGGGRGLSFGPVADGKNIVANPVGSTVHENVPVIVGATRTENTIYQVDSADYGKMTEEALLTSVKGRVGGDEAAKNAGAAKIIEMYKKQSPKATPYELSMNIGADAAPPGTGVANSRNQLGKAATYCYRWDWETPVMNLRAPHTMEIPFCMNHIDACTSMTGPITPKMKELESQIAGAWVALATTGNPKHSGLANWAPYTTENKVTMIFDTPCHLEKDLGSELRKLTGDRPARGARGGRGNT